MTTINEWREETDSIINELLEDGSNPESEYTIEHHFACHNFDRLEKLAVDLFKADFEVTDAEELELEDGTLLMCCDVISEVGLNAEVIDTQVEQLMNLAEKMNVNYDGWGTYFEDPNGEEGDEDDEDDAEGVDEDDNGVRH